MEAIVPMHRTLFGLVALCCAAGAAYAQDEVVPANQEPRHRVKAENEVVRVVDVEIPPGYRTLMHAHAMNYAFLMVSGARLRNEMPGKPAADIDIPAGMVGYYNASQGAYVHRFTNIGESVFRAIGIELLRSAASPDVTTPRDGGTGYVTVLDNERVRAYRLVLKPGESTGLVRFAPRTIRVAGTAAALKQRAADGSERQLNLTPAQFEWLAEASAANLTNVGAAPAEIYEFELK
jgi:hypothetical protein